MRKYSKKKNNGLLKLTKQISEHVSSLNTSKFFTGIIILTLNISSKYVTMGFSTSQEEYLKYSLGRQILVFAILWMGTRDIVIALVLTIVFFLFADYLFNDKSMYCIIPSKYKLNDKENEIKKPISQKEINDAIDLLKKARSQKQNNVITSNRQDMYVEKGLFKENFI